MLNTTYDNTIISLISLYDAIIPLSMVLNKAVSSKYFRRFFVCNYLLLSMNGHIHY